MFVLILRQNLQCFAKGFLSLITPKGVGRVMGDFGVEISLLTVSDVLEIADDELELTLEVVVPLRTS